ncbi:endo-1,4-beta-xylanase [Paenibacillus thailandensis]|uniref:Beta-xylanase n=1 Tax=Paenibacillus thailandensis TaxID=393250 RepID=A0ABW5R5I6_9BACL
MMSKLRRFNLFIFVTVIVVASSGALLLQLTNGDKKLSDLTLRKLADKNNILVGAAVNYSKLSRDSTYRSLLANEYNALTIENDIKFSRVHPIIGTYDYTKADAIVNYAINNDLKIRGHTLVWHTSNPDWLQNGNFTKDEMIQILRDHITNVVGRYKGKIFAWDVVNEAFNEDGTYRDSIWLKSIGKEYIPLAFQFAHEADPNALLFYNDYSNEGINPKSNAIYNLVRELKGKGTPIHGIGFQMHFSVNSDINYKKIEENMRRLKKAGMIVHFTEVDVKVTDLNKLPIQLTEQAVKYGELFNICLNSNGICKAFIIWGLTDKYSSSASAMPLIFDKYYKPKQSYLAIKNQLINKSSSIIKYGLTKNSVYMKKNGMDLVNGS